MTKLIVKTLKFIKNFIIDFWVFHLLELIWLTPAIYTLIAHPESVVVRILLVIVLFFLGTAEGYLLYMSIDDDKKVEDRLKEAEQRIADLEDNLRTGIISDPERFKIYNYSLKDLILFADMCKRNNVRDADLKQAAWNLEFAVRAVMSERQEIAKNMLDEITMMFTPNFEEAYKEMMENCILPYVKGEKNEN